MPWGTRLLLRDARRGAELAVVDDPFVVGTDPVTGEEKALAVEPTQVVRRRSSPRGKQARSTPALWTAGLTAVPGSQG